MTNKSLARKIAQKWDYNLMIGYLSFLDLSSNSNQHLTPYLNDYLKFLSNRMESIKSFKTARGHLNRFADAMSQIRIKRLGEISVKNIDQYLDSLAVSPKTKKNHLQSILGRNQN